MPRSGTGDRVEMALGIVAAVVVLLVIVMLGRATFPRM